MTQPTCETCRFYETNDWSCHRNPPWANKESETFAAFPPTRPYEWCGEHKPKSRVTENLT
jgi:hypothetical protein